MNGNDNQFNINNLCQFKIENWKTKKKKTKNQRKSELFFLRN